MRLNLLVLFGGRSVENEISVVTALQTIEAIDKDRYEVIPAYIAKSGKWYTGEGLLSLPAYKDMDKLLKSCRQVYFRPEYGNHTLYYSSCGLFGRKECASIDVVLPCLHGTNCEDGTIQGVLQSVGVPFVGCGVLASANGMDKITMKMILRECGIPVVDYCWFCDKEWYLERDAVISRIESTLGYPVIVKPANSGSSVGISAAHDRTELIASIDDAAQFTSRLIVETLVTELREINCSVMGDYYACKASVLESPSRSGEILSYQDKYEGGAGAKGGVKGGAKMPCVSGGKLGGGGVKTGSGVKFSGAKVGGGAKGRGMASCSREIPARLPSDVSEYIRSLALKTFKALSCDGLSRIDFIIDEATSKVYVNEINTIPGSLSSYLWEASGMTFPQAIDALIEQAFARSREQEAKSVDFGGNIFKHL